MHFVFQSEQILRLKRVRQALGASERWPSCVRRKQDFEGRLGSSIADALQRLFRTLQRSDLQLRGKCPTVSPSAPQIFAPRSEEHTSELQSLMRISYAVFCLKKKKNM